MTRRQIFCRGDATDPDNTQWYELRPDDSQIGLNLAYVRIEVTPGKRTTAVIREVADGYGNMLEPERVAVVADPNKDKHRDHAFHFSLNQWQDLARNVDVVEMRGCRKVGPDVVSRKELDQWMMSQTRDPRGFKRDAIREMGMRIGELIAQDLIEQLERPKTYEHECKFDFQPPSVDEINKVFKQIEDDPIFNKLGGKYRAVMDDRPRVESRQCSDCNGTGRYVGFTSDEDCGTCGGTGRAR